MIARLLGKFAAWALSKNAPGGYTGEDDPRWAYTIEVGGEPYLVRVLSPRLFGCRVYLHHFLRPDAGRQLHNHPWKWGAALVIAGAYDELRLLRDPLRSCRVMYDGTPVRLRRARRLNFLTHRDYHTVTRLHGDVWTIFITGPESQDWGFLVGDKHVPHKEHFRRLGRQ